MNRRLAIVGLVLAPIASSFASQSSGPETSELVPRQQELLGGWFAVANPEPEEDFGQFIARVARHQQGVRYDNPIVPPGEETLRVNLSEFECVSFIESSLAVARCAWTDQKNVDCFRRELENLRYRNGQLVDYASRLHYFSEWIQDNGRRNNVEDLTLSLGGKPLTSDFYYMSQLNRQHLPENSEQASKLRDIDKRLSGFEIQVLDREQAAEGVTSLQAGDVVAFVRPGRGLLIRHAGFAWRAPDGEIRLLHASSYHQRVVLTTSDLLDYLIRRPERKGIIIARPRAPSRAD